MPEICTSEKVAGLDREVSLSHSHHTVVVWDCTTRACTYPTPRQAADFDFLHGEEAWESTMNDRPIRAPLVLLPRAFLWGCQLAVQSAQPLLRSRGDDMIENDSVPLPYRLVFFEAQPTIRKPSAS